MRAARSDRRVEHAPAPCRAAGVACIAPSERRACEAGSTSRSALGNIALVTGPADTAPDAVLFAGTDDELAAVRTRLAALDGPLVPVIVARDGTYDAMRLLSERTVTINTTASGGNASLLSLEEQEPA